VHDSVTLFKILIVVLVVVYQGVQAMRKKAKAQPQDPVPSVPSYEPEPPAPKREDTMERIRTLVLGRATAPPPLIVAPPVSDNSVPAVVVSMNTAEPIRSLEPAAAQGIPSLRDLILAQVILSPPPGSRPGRQTGRSPLEFRR
jgi:hypothetical protein